jgi:hypothetical protein
MVLRIGIQRDLAEHHIGDWMTRFRDAVPGAGFYIEADYSEQMCTDLVAGAMDLAILYTPKPQPDLHFESLGEVAYRMVSTLTDRLAEVRADAYVRGNFAPAFSAAHAALLPRLDAAPISSGQNATVAGLVLALGGTAYVLEDTARAMQAAGQARAVQRRAGDPSAGLCRDSDPQPPPQRPSPPAVAAAHPLHRAPAARLSRRAPLYPPGSLRINRLSPGADPPRRDAPPHRVSRLTR